MLRGMLSVAAVIAALTFSNAVGGIELSPRKHPVCDYMGNQIYCYGGDTSATDDQRAVDTNLYSLDINRYYGQPTDSISNKWQTITPAAAFDTEQRRRPNAIVLADAKRLLVHAGSHPKLQRFVNQTIFYDTTTNSWQTLLPYAEPDRGVRQIFITALVNLPNNLVGFYGGTEQLSNTSVPQISASGETLALLNSNRSIVGFNNMITYSPDATSWTPFSPQINPPENYYPNSQTATLDPVSGKVYYFGGSFYTPAGKTAATVAPFNWAYTFNTKTGTWLNETFGGAIPGRREHHTTHLLPNSRDIILYGGTSDSDKPLEEYCFTLNLEDNTWTKQSNVNVPLELSGPRFDHASVLINTTLFIFYGRGWNGTLQSSFFSINVENVANIVYTTTIGPPSNNNTINPPTNNTGGNDQTPQSTGLSKGAIGGIAAGAVVAVLAILAFIAYCIRRKRKSDQNKAQDEHLIEQVHVDWDKIDDHYKEVSPATWSPSNSPQSQDTTVNANTKGSSSPLNDSNIANTSDTVPVKPSIYVPDVKPSIYIPDVKPSIDITDVNPSIDLADREYTVTKPDGG